MAYSTDGANWTAVANSTFGNTNINAIAYGNGKFVAGGDSGKMAWSADGVTWKAIANTAFDSRAIRAIAYGNGRFVAGGGVGWPPDGKITWSEGGTPP
jgi:hypothetical protein